MLRLFKLVIKHAGLGPITEYKHATDHRNAVMLVIDEYRLTEDDEVDVQEIIELPKSTYRVFKHTSYQIEQKT